MVAKAVEVRLTPEDRLVLEARLRSPTTEQRDVLRARIVLLADEGRSTRSIAKSVEVMPRTVSLWRGRYAREAWRALPTSRGPDLRRATTPRVGVASWRFSTARRRPGSPAGQAA